MSAAEFALGGLVLLPLLVGAVSVLLGHRSRRLLGTVTAAVVVVLAVVVLMEVAGGRTVELMLGGFEAPLGIHLRADGLSALFVTMTAAVGAITTSYAAVLPHATGRRLVSAGGVSPQDPTSPNLWRPAHPGFWPLWLGCWSGLNAVFVSGDLFNTYVGLELVALTAVGLVALGGPSSWSAALRYLFVAVIGSLLFLIGVGLIVSTTGTLDIDQAAAVLHQQSEGRPAAVFALCLMTVGLGMKMALAPMHRWLIPAHSDAPSAVSPLLSALVIKAAVFVLLRCWLWLVPPGMLEGAVVQALSALAWIVAASGALALVLGSVMALRQSRLKPLVAYSTVAQVGYWVLFLPLVVDPGAAALEDQQSTTLADDAVIGAALGGTAVLALGHGLAKAALFLAVGYLKDLYGTDEIAALRGTVQHHPLVVLAMGLSAVGLIGVPVSLGFTGKWQLATAAVAAEHWWIVVVLVAATLLSAGYMVRAVAPLLLETQEDDQAVTTPESQFGRVPLLPQFAPFVLGALTVATGLLGAGVDDLLQVGAPW